VVEERAEAARPRPKRGRVLTFLGHVVDELRRVQWPDRRQTAQGTAVTLGFVVVAGGFLGLMDAIWQPIIEAIL
jgi:preprotein translocase SecE subunit